MEKCIAVEIYTPYGKYLATECDYLSLSTEVGVIGILPNHAPLVSTVIVSKLTIRKDKKESLFAIGKGVIHIKKDHKVVLLVDSIESKSEIDVARAREAKLRAEKRLKESHKDEIDVLRAKAALSRALNRLAVSDNN